MKRFLLGTLAFLLACLEGCVPGMLSVAKDVFWVTWIMVLGFPTIGPLALVLVALYFDDKRAAAV